MGHEPQTESLCVCGPLSGPAQTWRSNLTSHHCSQQASQGQRCQGREGRTCWPPSHSRWLRRRQHKKKKGRANGRWGWGVLSGCEWGRRPPARVRWLWRRGRTPQRLGGADHKGVRLSRDRPPRFISMETGGRGTPVGLSPLWPRSSESTWGCGLTITWAPGEQEALLRWPSTTCQSVISAQGVTRMKSAWELCAQTLFTGLL